MKRRKISYFVAILSVLLSCLFSIQVQAKTLEVGLGYPYSTIQDAIDAAGDGDTVLVHDGTYMENITFSGKAITVRSENGPESTIIDGNANGSVVTFNSSEGRNSVLDGFTTRNGLAPTGGGILCSATSPTIRACIISNNRTISGGGGGGIYCVSSSSSPLITNCEISNNEAPGTNGSGGGIECGLYSHPVIENCTITGNEAAKAGGGISCYASTAKITDCIISDNTANGLGGGIHCYNRNPIITNCIIIGNSVPGVGAGKGGGGISSFQCTPIVTNCTLSENTTANGHGGGIFCADASAVVVNSILWGNTAPEILLISGSSIDVTYSDVQQDSGTYPGVGNINTNPLFVSAATGDFHLAPGSPCSDAGTTTGAPEYDFEGDPRLSSVGGDDLPDMGADEFRALPPAPSNLEAHQIPGQIHIFWEDNSDNENGFVLEFKCTGGLLIWQTLATLGPNVCSFQMDNPILNETYYFRVYAYNDQGNSDYSNEASVFIYGLIQPLSIHAPNGGEVWSPGSTQQITWAKGISPCPRVTIQYSIDGGSSWISPPIATNILNAGSYSWTVPNTPSTNCIVKVQDAADGLPYDLSNKPFTIGLVPCKGDFDQDGDVDGSDLAIFAAGGTGITLEDFAADFGRTNREPIVYFADAAENPGSVYKVENGTESTYYNRTAGQLYNFAFSAEGILYYSNANDYDLYKLEGGEEILVYRHNTYLRDVAFDSEGRIYFSESRGGGGDGYIYRLEDGVASLYYTVLLSDVGFWAGDFAFDQDDNLYLSNGNIAGANIYKVVDGVPQIVFSAPSNEPIKGISFKSAGNLFYASWLGGNIYQVDFSTGERRLFYSNPDHLWLSDVFVW